MRCLALGRVLERAVARVGGVDPSLRTVGKDLDGHRLRGRAGLVAQQMHVPVARIDEPLALPVDRGRALAVVALIGGDLALGHRDQAGTWMRMPTGGTALLSSNQPAFSSVVSVLVTFVRTFSSNSRPACGRPPCVGWRLRSRFGDDVWGCGRGWDHPAV